VRVFHFLQSYCPDGEKISLACAHPQHHGMTCPLGLQDIRFDGSETGIFAYNAGICGQNFMRHQAIPEEIPKAHVLGHKNALMGENSC
jgi:hypothetical protein